MTTDVQAAEVHGFDPQPWAAEEAALQLGWLRECPYHGELFRTAGADRLMTAGQETVAQSLHASSEVAQLATQLLHAYGEQCPLCARDSTVPE